MPRIFVDFRPAEVVSKKETYVSFYVLNPYTGQLVRKRIRCNRTASRKDRIKYAKLVAQAVNERLFAGWNPFFDELPKTSVTIMEAIDMFLAAKEKTTRPRTMNSYSSSAHILKEWLCMRGMDGAYCVTIDKAAVTSYLEWAERTRKLSPRSYNNYCTFLYTLFDWFVQNGYASGNPVAGIPRKRVDRKKRVSIPKCDREAIREWVETECPRYYYVMQMCYRLFVRPAEICKLRIGHIDLQQGLLTIPSHIAKNHCDRVLGIPDELLGYFRTLSSYPASWYIFGDKHTYAPAAKQMAPTRIAEKWSEMRSALHLPASYQFYSLKDTGITEMLEAGVPAKFVKELADHHSLEMTEKYTHRSDAKKILEWNRLEF